MIYAPISQINKFIPDISALKVFIANLSPELETGNVSILSDDIFAVTAEYNTKNTNEAILESHREYIDVQIVIKGEELGKVIPISELTIEAEKPENDLIIYQKPAKFATEFILNPKVFAIFFDYDAHITQLHLPENKIFHAKKTVLKIKKTFFKNFNFFI